jgi:hypothetical protein
MREREKEPPWPNWRYYMEKSTTDLKMFGGIEAKGRKKGKAVPLTDRGGL